MAVSLVRSSNEYYTLSGSGFNGATGTLCVWCNPADTNTQAVISFNSGTTGQWNGFGGSAALEVHLAINTSWNATYEDGAGSARSITSGTPSTGTWTHFGMTWNTSGNLTMYVNGASTGTPQAFGSTSGNTCTNGRIGNTGSVSAGRSFNGRLAEAALYNAELSAADMLQLAAGFTPPLVRPAALTGYWPLKRDVATQPDLVGGDGGTRVATPDTYPHPAVFYPAQPYIVTVPAAVGGGGGGRLLDSLLLNGGRLAGRLVG